MPRISFTTNLRRHVDCPAADVTGITAAACLEDYFVRHPGVRSYVLDDQGRVRRHMTVFVNGEQLLDPTTQSDAVAPDDTITVMQALSGG